jgi:hypothetical protein
MVPVPLLRPDRAVPLDLGEAIRTIYEERVCDLRVDYAQPPPKPELSGDDAARIEARVRSGRRDGG